MDIHEGSRSGDRVRSFKNIKKDAIEAARDLLYGQDVIKKLHNAENEIEIYNIMVKARNAKR